MIVSVSVSASAQAKLIEKIISKEMGMMGHYGKTI